MHLVSFAIRIYHDARSPERHTCIFIGFEHINGLPGSLQLVSEMDSSAVLVPRVLNSSAVRVIV